MNEIVVVVKYKAGHTYDHKLIKTELHCINCGTKEVWEDESSHDYYVGSAHYCLSCDASFYVPTIALEPNEEDQQILQALKGGKE